MKGPFKRYMWLMNDEQYCAVQASLSAAVRCGNEADVCFIAGNIIIFGFFYACKK